MSQSMQNAIKRVETAFIADFPEMKNQVVFLDPTKFKSSSDMGYHIEDLCLAQIRKAVNESDNPEIKKYANNERYLTKKALDRYLQFHAFISMGMPAALFNGLKNNNGKMECDQFLIFPGKKDIELKDVLWRAFAGQMGNQIAEVNNKTLEELKESFLKECPMPDSFADQEMLQVFTLLHELGHALTFNSLEKEFAETVDVKQFMECMADAFASIYMYQTYGKDCPFVEDWQVFRDIASVIGSDIEHHTSHVLQDVIKMNKAGLLENLSPKETLQLAITLGKKHALNMDQSYNVRIAVKPAVIGTIIKSSAKGLLKGGLKSLFNKESDAREKAFKAVEDELVNGVKNGVLRVIKNKPETLEHFYKKAMTTKSPAAYDLLKSFFENVGKVWKDVPQQTITSYLSDIENRQDLPTTEPKMPFAAKQAQKLAIAANKKMMQNL